MYINNAIQNFPLRIMISRKLTRSRTEALYFAAYYYRLKIFELIHKVQKLRQTPSLKSYYIVKNLFRICCTKLQKIVGHLTSTCVLSFLPCCFVTHFKQTIQIQLHMYKVVENVRSYSFKSSFFYVSILKH